MRVVIVARPEMSPVELFDLAVEQGVTAIIDLRQQPGAVPTPLRHIYQRSPSRLADHFVKRFLQRRPCHTHCTTSRAAHTSGPPASSGSRAWAYVCDHVLLLLTDQDFATEARALIKQIESQAQIESREMNNESSQSRR
jgi:hypothetical protein